MASKPALSSSVTLTCRGHTRRLGRALGQVLTAGDLIILEGGLGAGKTFLVRALARGLGVPTEVRVVSPTFALVHELEGRLPLIHVDLYRVGDPGEVQELGLQERVGRDAAVVVEWGGRFADTLGPERLELQLTPLPETTDGQRSMPRRVDFTAYGNRGKALLARLQSQPAFRLLPPG